MDKLFVVSLTLFFGLGGWSAVNLTLEKRERERERERERAEIRSEIGKVTGTVANALTTNVPGKI